MCPGVNNGTLGKLVLNQLRRADGVVKSQYSPLSSQRRERISYFINIYLCELRGLCSKFDFLRRHQY